VSGICRYPDRCQGYAGTLTSVRVCRYPDWCQGYAERGILTESLIQRFPGCFNRRLSTRVRVSIGKVILSPGLIGLKSASKTDKSVAKDELVAQTGNLTRDPQFKGLNAIH